MYAHPFDRVREVVTRRPRHRAHAALDDVSFAVGAGEAFGIIGDNGAGKSTLLSIVAGVTAPSAGRATVSGTAGATLELGWGFQPELTGRQNLVLNAAMLGLSEREVRERTPDIIAFSELGSAIDEPLRTYSTGMAMRLAFAIAIQIDPQVLIVDEALSVGDGYFQRKCIQRIQAFLRAGGTLLLSSHAMYYVSEFCARTLWLREGKVAALGPTASVIRDYEDFLTARAADRLESPAPESQAARGPARIVDVTPCPAGGGIAPGDRWGLQITCEADEPALALHLAVGLDRVDGVQVFVCSTRHDSVAPLCGRTRYTVRLLVPEMPIVKGQFTAYVALLDEEALHVYDRRVLPGVLDIAASTYRLGLVAVEHSWEVDQR